MKVSDYIVKFLEDRGITDIFGIPGVGCGHFMNSLINSKIASHLVYHEQAAAFAACAYGQVSHRPGIAYTTAGPGGTNLITGIANAYCDSIPTIFIVGEKDLSSLRGSLRVRQRASQEVDIVNIALPITKWSYQIRDKKEVKYVLEKAFSLATSSRPGPVLLDIPSDIQRADIDDIGELDSFIESLDFADAEEQAVNEIITSINTAQKPVFLIGNGVKQNGLEDSLLEFAVSLDIPIVTTLICFDLYAEKDINLGFIGMDGDSAANAIVNEADLLVTFGARLNFKQINGRRSSFASKAKIVRIDCDPGELEYTLGDEVKICADLKTLVPTLLEKAHQIQPKGHTWLDFCIQQKQYSFRKPSLNPAGDAMAAELSKRIPENTILTVDTGSHRRWVMSQHVFKSGQRIFQSAGLASMGYSLPASIGAYYVVHRPIICLDGDGGIMMNLQELQFIERERLPITVIVFNNHCLGDIMEFQKRIFNGNYFTTTEESGYKAADFEQIAGAFHFRYMRICAPDEIEEIDFCSEEPQLIEIIVPSNED